MSLTRATPAPSERQSADRDADAAERERLIESLERLRSGLTTARDALDARIDRHRPAQAR